MKTRVFVFRGLVVALLFVAGILTFLNSFEGTFLPDVGMGQSLFWSFGILTVGVGLLVEFYYSLKYKKKGGGQDG